jgi:hypothetical protein
VRQRVRVFFYAISQYGSGRAIDLCHAYVEDKNRRLEYRQANNFFNKVAMGDNDVKTDHHQHHYDPVVIQTQ